MTNRARTLTLLASIAVLITGAIAAEPKALSARRSSENKPVAWAGAEGPIQSVAFDTTSVPAGASPQRLRSSDLNGDGIADIVGTSLGDQSVFVLTGNGDGTFKGAAEFATPGGTPVGLSLADLNGDGLIDAAVSTLNSDRSGGTLDLLLGDGQGGFRLSDQQYPLGPGIVASITAADLNKDGVVDLIVGLIPTVFQGISLQIFIGNGEGTYQQPISYTSPDTAYDVATGDFNGDGSVDLAVGSSGGLGILFGNGDGTFDSPVTYATEEPAFDLALGDFNGDGNIDVAIKTTGQNYRIAILLGSETGVFTQSTTYVMPVATDQIVAADLNGDGKLDLATTGGAEPMVYTLLGRGDGTFGSRGFFPCGAAPFGIVAADFDNDSLPDLATANESENTVSVLRQIEAVLSQTLVNFGKIGVGKHSPPVSVTFLNILE